MGDDLVKRLREIEWYMPTLASEVVFEAADRIEADAARIARLEDAGRKLLANWVREEQALTAAEARIAELEAALREIADGAFNDNGDVTMNHGHMIRAFFKARATLGEKE